MFQIDGDGLDDFQTFAKAAKRVQAEEKKKTTARKRKGGGGGKKRKPMEDTALTIRFIYRIKDRTSKTVHICQGVGQTEQVVARLEGEGHDLVQFSHNKGGTKLKRPIPYQCIMDSRGKDAGYCYSWRPTEEYTSIIVHSADNDLRLFTQVDWPYHPGGVHFRLKECTPEEKGQTTGGVVHMSREVMDEATYLKLAQDRGLFVAHKDVDPDEWLRATCRWMDVEPSNEMLDGFRAHLKRNVVAWPPTPAQVAEVNKGRSLTLDDDMEPNNYQQTRLKARAQAPDYELPYDAPTPIGLGVYERVEMHPQGERPKPSTSYFVTVFKPSGEQQIVTGGGASQCQMFVSSPIMDRLRGKGWTHFQIHRGSNVDAERGMEPIPECQPQPTVEVKKVEIAPSEDAETRRALQLAMMALRHVADQEPADRKTPAAEDWTDALDRISELVA
jgi:hypothetical protein